jgi:hypothetical protein
MRPYFVLTAVVLMAVAAFGQQSPRPYGGCVYGYGCGPSIPLVTTPEVTLQQVSPNPVGATNATTGLIAGATNGTLSQIEGSTSSVYTVSVWYQGGAPVITPAVSLWPEELGREGHIRREGGFQGAREGMFAERAREEGPRGVRPGEVRQFEGRPGEGRPGEERRREEHAREDKSLYHPEEARGEWTYFVGHEGTTESTSVVKDFKKAGRTYTNEDVTRQNEKNGAVKYDDKTEKM